MKIKVFTLLFIGLFISISIQAGILAAKTRLVFKEGAHEQSLMLANTNEYSITLQTWIDWGEGNPDAREIPFLVLPPLVKITSEGIQGIRIVYNRKPLPIDRESVFWLNLYEIPKTKRTNNQVANMSLAMDTQLKLFYRPKQITKMSPAIIVKYLKFKIIEEPGKTYFGMH
jgi:P pilus assembly chaperone PapD